MKEIDSKLSSRRSIRLRDYDYSQEGRYFITVCTYQSKCILGEIIDGKMHMNELGKIAEEAWDCIPDIFPHVTAGLFVVMPNHVHGIINIDDAALSVRKMKSGTSQTVGSMIRAFKSKVTLWARKHTAIQDVWQRNYYEHIIRDEQDYSRIYEYIINNPEGWKKDGLYPNYVLR